MNPSITIDLDDLKRASEQLIDVVRSRTGPRIELDLDMYWSVPEQGRYDVHHEPSELEVGSLVDDLGRVQDAMEQPEQALGYHLVWLSAILRAVGDQNPS